MVGSVNGLMPSGNKPSILTHVDLDCCGYMVLLGHNAIAAQSQVVYR